jgi:hypothetical protein
MDMSTFLRSFYAYFRFNKKQRGYNASENDTMIFYKAINQGAVYTEKPVSSIYLLNIGDMIIYNNIPYYYKGNDEWIGVDGSII